MDTQCWCRSKMFIIVRGRLFLNFFVNDLFVDANCITSSAHCYSHKKVAITCSAKIRGENTSTRSAIIDVHFYRSGPDQFEGLRTEETNAVEAKIPAVRRFILLTQL